MLSRMKLALACLLFCCASLAAQTFTFKSITFDGAPQYTPAELLTMSGLATGKSYTDADLKTALHKLDDTGLFSRINYKTEGSVLHILLEPMDAGATRTVHYANFVMATPAELNTEIHQRLPAFTGRIPATGDLEQKVGQALEAILRQRGIAATVTSIGNENGSVDYSIAKPPVVVGKIAVQGIDLGSDPKLGAIRDRIVGSEYVDGASTDALKVNLVDAYHDLGYPDFTIGTLTHSPPAVTAERITVDLTGTAEPGALYTIAKVTLPKLQPRITDEELAKANQLKVGAPASRIEVLSTQRRLDVVFAGHGYLDAKTTLDFTKDTAAHTLSYVFKTVPGAEYTFRSLLTPGLNEDQATLVRGEFKLPPGALYDGAAARVFLSPALRNVCSGAPMKVALRKELRTHEVDVLASCGAVLH